MLDISVRDDTLTVTGAEMGDPLLRAAPLDSTPEENKPLAELNVDEGESIFLVLSANRKALFLSVVSRSSDLTTALDALETIAIVISIQDKEKDTEYNISTHKHA